MAHIVILGAGLGGMPMAYEMRELARRDDRITVVSNNPNFHFVPSNPWVAVQWRTRQDIEIDAGAALRRKGIDDEAHAAHWGLKRDRSLPDEGRSKKGKCGSRHGECHDRPSDHVRNRCRNAKSQ